MNNNNEVNDVLGIDISKAKFDVALIQGNAKIKSKVFGNNPEGFAELQAWLNLQSVTNLHSCMEATSTVNGIMRVCDQSCRFLHVSCSYPYLSFPDFG